MTFKRPSYLIPACLAAPALFAALPATAAPRKAAVRPAPKPTSVIVLPADPLLNGLLFLDTMQIRYKVVTPVAPGTHTLEVRSASRKDYGYFGTVKVAAGQQVKVYPKGKAIPTEAPPPAAANASELVQRGRALLSQGQYAAAAEELTRAAALTPSDAALQNDLGLALIGSNSTIKARAAFAAAVNLAPTVPAYQANAEFSAWSYAQQLFESGLWEWQEDIKDWQPLDRKPDEERVPPATITKVPRGGERWQVRYVIRNPYRDSSGELYLRLTDREGKILVKRRISDIPPGKQVTIQTGFTGVLGSGAVMPLSLMPGEQDPTEVIPAPRRMSDAELLWRRVQGVASIGTMPAGAVALGGAPPTTVQPVDGVSTPVEPPAITPQPETDPLPPIITENEETVPL